MADQETRGRVLEAAAQLFAEHGFDRVTVRDICRKARANVAAVNYHFNGKQGLYIAVMQSAIATMQGTTDAARAAGAGGTAEERLRAYVRVFLERVTGAGQDSWIHQLMMRELSDPSPALDMVAEQVLKPRLMYLCGIIAELADLAADDLRVVRCAQSVQVQFHTLFWSDVMGKIAPATHAIPDSLDAMADHITRFSIGGVQSLRPSG